MKLLVNLCSYLGYGMLWGVSFLPLPVMYLMTDVLFVILFYGVHYRRKVVDMNLRNSFPEKSGGRDQETLCHGERGCATSLFRART